MIRVLLVDDQTLVRQGIRSLLELSAEVQVVAEADDGLTGLTAAREHEPDVVLLDLRMPGHDGLWMLDALREARIEVAVLVLTTFDDDELVLRAVRAGAKGYLLKDVTLDLLVGAIRTLHEGRTLLQPAITDRLLRAIRGNTLPDPGFRPVESITDRELDVLRLMACGYTNRQIADALFLAEGTVKNHVSALLIKLDARDRTNAVLRALRYGLLG
ncbi:response regulator transcription factor [Streptosporangium fragile]|uniref:Response regulator transcription factor n=1 Tax=Streptosporangium fragile TaxID=46186 RepID=A0ABN3VW24_9ACTN